MGQVLAESQERLVEVEATGRERPEPAPVGEQKTFRSYDPEQVLLMAPVLTSGFPRATSPTSSPIWSIPRLSSRRSMPPMNQSAAIRPMTRA